MPAHPLPAARIALQKCEHVSQITRGAALILLTVVRASHLQLPVIIRGLLLVVHIVHQQRQLAYQADGLYQLHVPHLPEQDMPHLRLLAVHMALRVKVKLANQMARGPEHTL